MFIFLQNEDTDSNDYRLLYIFLPLCLFTCNMHTQFELVTPEKNKKKKEKQKNKTYQQNAIYRFNLSAALNFDLEIKVTETNVAQSNSQSIISKDCLTKK